jgi:cell pole-organizing protein PopZ
MEEILAAIRRIIADEGGPDAAKPVEASAQDAPAPATAKGGLSRDEIEAIAARVEAAKPSDVLTLSDVVEPEQQKNAKPVEFATSKVPREPAREQPREPKGFGAIDPVENLFRDEIERNPPASSVERSLATPLTGDDEEKAPAPAPAAAKSARPAPQPTNEPHKGASMAAKITPPPSIIDDPALMSPAATAAVSAAFNSLASTILSKDARTLEDLVREMMKPMLRSWLDDNLPSLVERLVRSEIERVSRSGR